MDCFFPGRVLLAPEDFGIADIEGRLAEEIGLPFRIEFGVGDIIERYPERRRFETREPFKRGPLPVVGRVPEGAEQDAATRLASLKMIGAACPDYRVDLSAVTTLNATAIQAAVRLIDADPRSSSCGGGAIVAILDSGVDPSVLGIPRRVFGTQFDVTDPYDRGNAPHDHVGHGTLVAAIIQSIAPAAELVSIKVAGGSSALSGVIAGLYLAADNGCNVVNMSFSVSCDVRRCKVCKTPSGSPTSVPQMAYFFDTFRRDHPSCVLLAAAGNREGHHQPSVAMPAVFSGVIAVGQCDERAKGPAANSSYREVPSDRYVLAPGGSRQSVDALGVVQPYGKPDPLYGTSFSTAFASGVACRHVCAYYGGKCASRRSSGMSLPDYVLSEMASGADRSWPDFQPDLHGIGTLRYA